MKIVSTGKTISTTEYLRRKKLEQRKRFLFIVSCILFLIALAIFLSRLERLRINSVSVEGSKVVNKDEVKRETLEILSGYYFFLVPKNNALIYGEERLKKALYKEFPRFSSIDISLDNLQSLTLSVAEREPYALYCPDSVYGIEDPDLGRGGCYFLDEEGFIFDEAPVFSDGVYFVYASDVPLESPKGEFLISSEEFKSLSGFIEGLKSLDLEPRAVEISNDELAVTLPRDARILAPRETNLALIYSNLETFLLSEAIKKEKDFLERFAELDLRTENKVFWKVK